MESGFGGMESIRQKEMTRKDIQKSMKKLGIGPFFIEERILGEIPGEPPYDYKFYMFNGVVGTVRIGARRGVDASCRMLVDENFNRVDAFGCFYYVSAKEKRTDKTGQCSAFGAVDLTQGEKRELFSCGDVEKPEAWDKLVETAKRLSRMVGIFMRVDLFEDTLTGEIVLGEFTPWPDNGNNHCMATIDPETGCVDPCRLGRLWEQGNKDANSMEGGPNPLYPEYLKGWSRLSPPEQCERVMEASSAQSNEQLPSRRQVNSG
jgi:hypothetical protein